MEMAVRIEKIFNIRREYDIVNCEIPGIPKKLGVDNSLVKSMTSFAFTGFDDMLLKIKEQMAGRK
jgi:hypothetical protein